MAMRERMGRAASPSAAVLDSQSDKSEEKRAVETTTWVTTPVSKQVKGRKIRALVDSEGLPMRASFIPPRSRTATGPGRSSTRYAGASGGSN
jgi:hypothetical protein